MGTMYKHSTGLLLPLAGKSVCEQLDKLRKAVQLEEIGTKEGLLYRPSCANCTQNQGMGSCVSGTERTWLAVDESKGVLVKED